MSGFFEEKVKRFIEWTTKGMGVRGGGGGGQGKEGWVGGGSAEREGVFVSDGQKDRRVWTIPEQHQWQW